MIVFSLDVANQNLKLRKYNKEIITTNSVNYFECSINFNGFWNNHDVQKSIIFYQSTKYKYEIALFDNKCVIPSEVLQHPEMPLFIGMVGINEDPYTILTTNIVCIDLTEGILRSNTQSPEITPTIYDQLLSEFHTMYDDVINKLSNKQDKLTSENAGDNIAITYDGDIVKISTTGEIPVNYEDLNNLPKINNTTIIGNLSLSDIGIPTKTSELTNDSGFITNAVNNLVNYYLKTDTYTKTEVNNLISAISTMSLQVVEVLPTEDIKTNIIYLVPRQTAETGNIYDEYIYVSNAWEKIGNTDVDLTGYATETWVNTQIAGFLTQTQIEGLINTALNNYYTKTEVDTELAKKQNTIDSSHKLSYEYIDGLSTVGHSGSYTDLTNKPSLASVATTGSYTDLTNKPTIPTVDQTYNATSPNAQSGVAVVEAVNVKEDKSRILDYITYTKSTDNQITISGLKSGVQPAALVGNFIIPELIEGCPVIAIAAFTFEICSGITSITIPDSVTSIGNDAFYGCAGLTTITIPDRVTSIESNAFYRCISLTNITIPDSVTSIENGAFSGCNALTDVYYEGSETDWDNIEISLQGNDPLLNATKHYNQKLATLEDVETKLAEKQDIIDSNNKLPYNLISDTPAIPTKTSDLTNDSGFITNAVNNLVNYYLKSETYTKTEVDTAVGNKENTSNKVTSLSAQSTDAQYPSAKCVYDIVGDIESLLNALR